MVEISEYLNKNGGKQHEKATGSRIMLNCMLSDIYIAILSPLQLVTCSALAAVWHSIVYMPQPTGGYTLGTD